MKRKPYFLVLTWSLYNFRKDVRKVKVALKLSFRIRIRLPTENILYALEVVEDPITFSHRINLCWSSINSIYYCFRHSPLYWRINLESFVPCINSSYGMKACQPTRTKSLSLSCSKELLTSLGCFVHKRFMSRRLLTAFLQTV